MGDGVSKAGWKMGGRRGREGGLREAVVTTQAWMLVSTCLLLLGYLDLAGPVIVIFFAFKLPPSPIPAKQ